jgi:hypothetical protein
MILKKNQRANVSNSIYQQKGAGIGLSVSNGMLINNRMDSMSGLQQASEMNKMRKVAEKVEMISRAINISKVESDDECMMYSGPSARY